MPATDTPSDALRQVLISMRPRQWVKNLLLFAGLLLNLAHSSWAMLGYAAGGFFCFCLLSGAVYLVNDAIDAEADRLHPRKSKRPIAAGLLSRQTALMGAALAALAGLMGAFGVSPYFGVTASAYLLISLLYSQIFKHHIIVDIIFLALGFVLRAIAGIIVIRYQSGPEVPLTPWFVLCVFFLSLFIAICKRRHELVSMENGGEHRRVLAQYNVAFLDQMISVVTSATVISYSLYLVTGMPAIKVGHQSLALIATLPFVIYGIFRYLFLVYRQGEGGEPERLLFADKPLFFNTVLWLAIMAFFYFHYSSS